MYLISYDIASNKIRNKVMKELKNYGKHIQYSVFECDLNEREYKKLYSSLLRITQTMKDGNIRFYRLSDTEYAKTVTIGNPEYLTTESKQDVIFI